MASFLDGLFGGGNEREAAEKNRAELSGYLTKGLGYLDSGLATSKGALPMQRIRRNSRSPQAPAIRRELMRALMC